MAYTGCTCRCCVLLPLLRLLLGLQALTQALTEIAGLLDICARYNIIRACMSAGALCCRTARLRGVLDNMAHNV